MQPMNDVVRQMLESYPCKTRDDHINALREIIQQLALLGLWRSKFFEHAAFYGGTALRVLHGLDRYSEDIDFSLLKPDAAFSLAAYGDALKKELAGFGIDVAFERRPVVGRQTAIESAFLKTNTLRQFLRVNIDDNIMRGLHSNEVLKIKIEVDTDPPAGFETESMPILTPIPFAVRVYTLPDLFAGKMHAVLCRRWKNRVKGRDWYDLVWYIARHPQLRLRHLELRMRQSGDWTGDQPLRREDLLNRLRSSVLALDVNRAREEVDRFVRDKSAVAVWSPEFFTQIVNRIETV
jgi:predicted nucleotidyltransferase component of viral defense system